MAKASRFGKIGEVLSDVFGATVGDIIAAPIKDRLLPKAMEGREQKIATMIFGPTQLDERIFIGALNRIPAIRSAEKMQDGPAIVSQLLARLATMATELQDAFRLSVIQMGDGKNEPDIVKTAETLVNKDHPDIDKTARVLIQIAQMSEPDWINFRKIFNLETKALPFDLGRECDRIETRLATIRSRPSTLSWLQRFNFFSLSAPSLKE